MKKEEAIKFAEYAIGMTEIPEVKEFYRMCLSALRGPTREQVEQAWRGEWIKDSSVQILAPGGQKYHFRCTTCGYITRLHNQDFCPACGAAQTEKAVDIIMERLEAMDDDY